MCCSEIPARNLSGVQALKDNYHTVDSRPDADICRTDSFALFKLSRIIIFTNDDKPIDDIYHLKLLQFL